MSSHTERKPRSHQRGGDSGEESSSAALEIQIISPPTAAEASQALTTIGSTSRRPAQGSLVVFQDEEGRYNTVAEFAQYLEGEENEAVRYDVFRGQVEKHNAWGEATEQWAEYLSDLRKRFRLTIKEEDKELFEDMEARAAKSRGTADRIAYAQGVVRGVWPADIGFFISYGQQSSQFWRTVQALASNAQGKDTSFKKALMLINMAVLGRVTSKKRGTSTALHIQTTDIKAAISHLSEVPSGRAYREAIQAAGYGLNKDGVICPAEQAVRVITEHGEDDGDGEIAGVGFPSPGLGNQQRRARDIDTEDNEEDLEDLEDLDDIADLVDHNYDQGGADFYGDQVAQEAAAEDDEYAGAPPAKRRKGSKGKAVAIGDEGAVEHNCRCETTVSKRFLQPFKRGYRPVAIHHCKIIKTWMAHKGSTCYHHDTLILSSLGMRSQGLNKTRAKERLTAFYLAAISSTLGDMKSDDFTYSWFRRSHRPVRADDALGPYKYHHSPPGTYRLTIEEQKDLCLYLGIDHDEWDKAGSVNVDCFGWWKTETYNNISIYDVALQEFDMYDHHLRLIDDKSNYGWLRTMFHGLAQQAMRQDPMYWMMYAALRKDCNADIVSYPYYAKYQKRGDWTFFRHIDINIADLAKAGRGAYQIQGTVSLDEERGDDCTEIVPGMHRHIQTWAKALETRKGVKLSGLVNAITDKVFSDEDKKEYNTDWVAVPCKLLQVRISQPHIPHGAQGPAKGVRRTMLPWFVTVQADANHLEVLESGTWDDLAKAHRELTSAPRTPSGLANRYGDIPYAFPAAVPLSGLGALSDSLVCRYKPNNPIVMYVKKMLVNGSKEVRDRYITEWRTAATKAVVEAFEVVKTLEKDAFKGKSYFNMVEQGGEAAQADAIPEGEGSYQFNPHGARDSKAKEMAEPGSDGGSEGSLKASGSSQDDAE